MQPLVLFQNAASGDHDARGVRERIVARLQDERVEHRFVVRDEGQQLADALGMFRQELVRTGGWPVAVGGDGTINAVAAIALEGAGRIGVIPSGTFNFVARSNAVPEDLEGAVSVLLDGEDGAIQVGRVGERIFLVNACIGLYAKLLSEREALKRSVGRGRIVAGLSAVLTALKRYQRVGLAIEDDYGCERTRAATFLVSNNRLQLQMAGLHDAPLVEEGHMLGILLEPVSAPVLLQMLVRGALGALDGSSALRTFPLRRVDVDLPARKRRDIRVAIDGEITHMRLPLCFDLHPRMLQLRIPRRGLPVASAHAGGREDLRV